MLRNKQTGEVVDGHVIVAIRSDIDPSIMMHDNTVGSVAKLNEKWEDYKPTEPLIKDEKIRKAVRAWAEVNKIEDDEKVIYQEINWELYYLKVGLASIQFNVPLRIADGSYTIEELCGEEEE